MPRWNTHHARSFSNNHPNQAAKATEEHGRLVQTVRSRSKPTMSESRKTQEPPSESTGHCRHGYHAASTTAYSEIPDDPEHLSTRWVLLGSKMSGPCDMVGNRALKRRAESRRWLHCPLTRWCEIRGRRHPSHEADHSDLFRGPVSNLPDDPDSSTRTAPSGYDGTAYHRTCFRESSGDKPREHHRDKRHENRFQCLQQIPHLQKQQLQHILNQQRQHRQKPLHQRQLHTMLDPARALVERVGDEAGEDPWPWTCPETLHSWRSAKTRTTSDEVGAARRQHVEKFMNVQDAIINVALLDDVWTVCMITERGGQTDDARKRAACERKRGLLFRICPRTGWQNPQHNPSKTSKLISARKVFEECHFCPQSVRRNRAEPQHNLETHFCSQQSVRLQNLGRASAEPWPTQIICEMTVFPCNGAESLTAQQSASRAPAEPRKSLLPNKRF